MARLTGLLEFAHHFPSLVQKGGGLGWQVPWINLASSCSLLFLALPPKTLGSPLDTQTPLRAAALSTASNAICVMQDGMDQSKFRVPRVRTAKSKLFSSLFRPQLHIAGSWIHGKTLLLSVSDEDCGKDAAAQLEQLSLALETVWAEHRKLPLGLCVQCDNTYMEGKNRFVIAYTTSSWSLWGCFGGAWHPTSG